MADIRTLDLNLLKAFDALIDERNVTRAAARLALTQPAVSGMLTRLRESFGDPLFVRSQRGMVPTLRAQALAAPVKKVLAEVEALLRPADFDPASSTLTLNIAATDYALRVIVLPFIRLLRTEAPYMRVAVRPIDDTQAARQLERGEIDLALQTLDTALPDLHARRLFDENYVCVLRSDHPDARQQRMSLHRFCELDHALVSLSGDAFSGATDQALALLGRSRRVVASVASFLVLPDLLRSSDLVAVLPRRLVADQEGLAIMPPPVEVAGFTKFLVWHERTHLDPGHQWARARLAKTCSETAEA